MKKFKSPLRYPGGKQKLAPFVIDILRSCQDSPGDYVEPFAGGAGVAIQLLLSGEVQRIHLNDLCVPVYAFWRSITTKPEEFCRRVSKVALNIQEWRKQREILNSPRGRSQLDIAFSFFYLNRCNRSGILSAGPIGGYGQTGEWKIDARFPKAELIRRIEMLASRSKSITVKNQNAEHFLADYVSKLPKNTLVYCDPPYYQKADRLYLNHFQPKDHKSLARLIQSKLKCPWIVSYDNVPEIVAHYSKRKRLVYELQYNAADAYKGTELIIFSDTLRIPVSHSLTLC